MLFDYNDNSLSFTERHDETGGRLKEFSFRYYDCFCGHAEYRIVATTSRHHNHFDIVQCLGCGTLRMNPYLSDESIVTYYKEVYGPVKRKGISAEGLYARQAKDSEKLRDILAPHLKPESLLLDYGSGAGGKMDALKTSGFSGVHVFDYDKNYMDYALQKGFRAHSDGTRYDMVVLSHVIEHINHPVPFLQELAKTHLKASGLVYLEVPLIENLKRFLHDIHLAHKFYFTREGLTLLAAMAGYSVVANAKNGIVVKHSGGATPDGMVESAHASGMKEVGRLQRYQRKKALLMKLGIGKY